MIIGIIHPRCCVWWNFYRAAPPCDKNSVSNFGKIEESKVSGQAKAQLYIAKVTPIEKPKEGINIDGIGSRTAQLLGA